MSRRLQVTSLLVLGYTLACNSTLPGQETGVTIVSAESSAFLAGSAGSAWASDYSASNLTSVETKRSAASAFATDQQDRAPAPPCGRNSCCRSGCPCSCDFPTWYITGEALFLDRNNNTGNQVLVEQDLTGNVLLTTGDLDPSWVTGPRIMIGYCTSACTAWELSYFGLHDWDASRTLTGNNNLNLVGDLGLAANLDFFNADVMTASYSSEIHNAELNYFWNSGGYVTWLAGFRYFHINERFNLTSTDVQTGTSEYDIRSLNNLYGGQLGARIGNYGCRWGWDLTGKAGIYGNDAQQRQFVGDFDGFVLRDSQTDGGQVAFIGDIGANLVYQVSRNLLIRGGYNVMWVEGVALAPNQIDLTDTPTSGTALRSGGGVFFHGANAGVTYRW